MNNTGLDLLDASYKVLEDLKNLVLMEEFDAVIPMSNESLRLSSDADRYFEPDLRESYLERLKKILALRTEVRSLLEAKYEGLRSELQELKHEKRRMNGYQRSVSMVLQ